MAACKGPACPISYLTFGNYSNTGNLVAMSSVPYPQSLQRIANADFVDGNARAPYHEDFVLERINKAQDEQHAGRATAARLPRVEHAQNMLYAAQINSKALQRVTPFMRTTTPTR